MGFLDRFRRAAPTPDKAPEQKLYYYPDQLSPSVASDRDVASAIRMGILVHGPGATELTYSAYHYNDANSAVFACLSAIGTAYPEAPTRVYRETEPGDREAIPDHPLQAVLDHPNPVHTREELWHYTQWCKHVSGNAYWRKTRAGAGNVVQLWPISPARIQPVTTKQDAARGVFISYYAYLYDMSKDPERIPPEDIIHFRLGIDDKDNRIGCSPLAKLVREVMGDDYAHQWQTAMLHNGGSAGMIVQVPSDTTMTGEEAEVLKDQLSERFGGNNRGRVGVLTGGATMAPYGFSPEQMDMKALHRIPEERIAAVLRVPAIIAGLGAGLDRSTYANFREAREMFAEMTILPLYSFDAAVLNAQLLPEFNSDTSVKLAFDITDLRALQEDEDNKWARLDRAVKTGWVRPDEARSDVGLPPDLGELPRPQMPQFPGQQQDDQEQLPPGQKARKPNPEAINRLPELIQAFSDALEPGFEKSMDRYFDGQRRRVKRNLVG
jgi:HK97 family phage portal protein